MKVEEQGDFDNCIFQPCSRRGHGRIADQL